ncbi:MAG: BamA/TamA family outer membrane protein, partial [Lacipirellulaceae bacterium]
EVVDIYINGNETQTGRLMLGVGVNSDAGVVGNIVIDERNFNWRRPPRSFDDIRNGYAFRGDGQRFRIDASPGSEVNRYLVSFQDPYIFDRPISLGLSASYFDRRYRNWDEQRLGGRISLGRQWVERDLSATISYRGENVNIHDISNPAQPVLAAAVGDNSQHGFRLSVINDTRDSAFLPTQGHYIELAGEQVIGSFDYPRVTAELREHLLLFERPDHSGRHVLSYSTNFGYTGTQTPIYEHFFAGGFATMRGFDFRGASPIDVANGNVEVGGHFQWLNSFQYLFPITADEMLHGVAFVDFGTVEPDIEINDFRVAPGVGLRITVPAMGPAPIALDFAFPVAKADFDDTQVFSFSLGFSR